MSNKFKFSSRNLNKRFLEDSGGGPLAKYRRLLEETITLTSTIRGYRTVSHIVATYEQTKKEIGTKFKMIESIQNH